MALRNEYHYPGSKSMKLSKLLLLFVFAALIACNQSDSVDTPDTSESTNSANDQPQNAPSEKAAAPEPERTGKVLARVNGKPIYEDDLNGKNLEFIITEEIIYQVGLQNGVSEEIEEKVKNFERTLIINETKVELLENMPPAKQISEEDIEKHYEINKDKYMYLRIHEISAPDVNVGLEIKKRAEAGEELEDIANSYTDIAVTVTDIGYNRQMAQEFENKELGSISEVIQKPNGTFSVLKVVDVKDVPLQNSRKSIKHILEAKRKAEMFDNYAKRLANENNITIEIVE